MINKYFPEVENWYQIPDRDIHKDNVIKRWWNDNAGASLRIVKAEPPFSAVNTKYALEIQNDGVAYWDTVTERNSKEKVEQDAYEKAKEIENNGN